MKDFMKKLDGNHPIKDVAIFIGGVLTGAALASSKDERILSEKERENIFLKRSGEEEEGSEAHSDETNNSSESTSK